MSIKNFKISTTQTIAWTERLAMLLRSGISLLEAISLMNTDQKFIKINSRIIESVSRGNSFSSVLDELKMSKTLVHLVHIGETSGSLVGALEHAALYFRTKEEIKQKIISASLYPALIGVATCGVAGFLVAFIFPKIVPLFSSMNIVLPLPTRILLATNQFLSHYWMLVIITFAFLVTAAAISYRVSRPVRRSCESFLFGMPIAGSLIRDHGYTRLFQIISIQLEHGSSLPHALAETAKSERNIHFSEALIKASDEISRGVSFSSSLRKYNRLFSPDVVGLLSIAERTGEVSKSCNFISENSKSRIDQTITTMSRFVEPVLMLGMGIAVGSIALSIIMPIYEITNKINMH